MSPVPSPTGGAAPATVPTAASPPPTARLAEGRPVALRGLYAITPDLPDEPALCRLVGRALEGGIDALQWRIKSGDTAKRLRLAEAVLRLTREVGVPLIINDDVELACAVGATGVHIGRDDGDPASVRERIGPRMWLGVSCYNDLERAQRCIGIADHVGFGSVFASPTKPAAVRAPLALFSQAQALGLNTVGIGGIDRHNAASVIDAGADAVAIITDLFGDPDPAMAARTLRTRVHEALDRRRGP